MGRRGAFLGGAHRSTPGIRGQAQWDGWCLGEYDFLLGNGVLGFGIGRAA
jgi:hypothetical protein